MTDDHPYRFNLYPESTELPPLSLEESYQRVLDSAVQIEISFPEKTETIDAVDQDGKTLKFGNILSSINK